MLLQLYFLKPRAGFLHHFLPPGITIFLLLLSGRNINALHAQTPFDGIMMPKHNACIFAGYSQGSFDHYWEAERLRTNETISKFTRRSYSWMAAVGIIDKLNVYAGFPYIQTSSAEPNGGRLDGVNGLQDLELAAKYQFLNKEGEFGTTRASATIDFTTPLTKYLSDYQPYSIGLGAPQLTYQLLVSHQFKPGVYLRANAAYVWRGYTKAERIYYYADGSHYSDWMDVPSAWTFGGALGGYMFGEDLRLELSYVNFSSTDGDDIRPYNSSQPTNKVDFGQVGFLAQYKPKFAKGLGFIVNHQRTITGRNTGKINTTSFGLTYQFVYYKNKPTNEN